MAIAISTRTSVAGPNGAQSDHQMGTGCTVDRIRPDLLVESAEV